ncbi:uncharacterized protein LOC8265180 [Ricinus communis]|uniref:Uncharacterized protein n=1 Tax=Ricinus communis TaxID=3988 RepID=B9RNM1_RICCO|nr:uncharacterized protein LOC8265180 [Ricinus communis]EEF46789.1 conserved hypothetical protein [Ricinus communis]|eukprot:XP_002515340.1 uncharacterized protein LOC8265180 [Ricinus communis]
MGRQRQQNWTVLGHLKKAVKKLNFLLRFNLRGWRIASIVRNVSKRPQLRLKSFNDRLGLHGCIEDLESDRSEMVKTLQRTRSYASDEDIDQRAEIFIANFRRQLLLERQVSLQVRYYRGNSFTRDY